MRSGIQAPQTGELLRGPGAALKRNLPELNSYQKDCLRKARKYSVEQNVKIDALRQTIVQQQQVRLLIILIAILHAINVSQLPVWLLGDW